MKRIRSIQAGWVMLLATLLLGLIVTPAGANSITMWHTAQRLNNATAVNATIYITTGTLVPIFQSRIDQQVPVAVNSAISNIVGTLPPQDRGWARQMATTLIAPSAYLTSLTTQSGGLATSVRVSLYPGDPQPINVNMLISLSVINASTVQVSARPLNGSPALVNGPLTTFQIPIGQLTHISTTPGCGDAALAVNLQFPLALGQSQASAQVHPPAMDALLSRTTLRQTFGQAHFNATANPSTNANAYVEIPASSLASMGSGIGDLPISSSMMAKNIQIGVQGGNMVINSDVYDSLWGKIGTAVTTVAPTASGGSLAVHVLSTSLTILNIFTFPYNSYNTQIEQTLNAKLNSALKGKFYVTQAAIGSNTHVPCTAGNSLVLTGSANLG